MPRSTRFPLLLAVLSAVSVAAVAPPIAGALTTSHGAASRKPFAWLRASSPPASWRPLVISAGAATLWAPPAFPPLPGDPGSASAGLRDPTGAYRAYLNTTPQQGAEQLRGFAAFRIHLLGGDHDEAVREEAGAEHLTFRGGQGSCVIDRYVTRVGHHRYREIACFVVSARGHGSVVVAAATLQDWNRYQSTLRTAVASFGVA